MRIALVDDHQLFRKGMASLLEKIEGVSLVLEAAHGRELLDGLKECPADLALLDLKMPVLDGRHTLAELKQHYPDTKVIFLSMETGDETILRCMEEGASGFLPKDAHPDEVRQALSAIQEKGIYLNDQTGRIMLEGLNDWKQGTRQPGIQLSERELAVLKGICKQQSTVEIADQLFLSPRTVEGYRRDLLEKVDTKNSVGLVLFAAKQGLLEKWMSEDSKAANQ